MRRCSFCIKSRFTIDIQDLAERFPDDDVSSPVKDVFNEMLDTIRGEDNIESDLADFLTALDLPHDRSTNKTPRTSKSNARNITIEARKVFSQYKAYAESAPWSLGELEHALRLLVGQKLTKLSVCLFLDALDEYDGYPKFIASFIMNLFKYSSAEDVSSTTKLRILVSSRRWKEFEKAFGSGPGL